MQVSVETTSELGRKLTVEIPEQRIQEAVTSRLSSLAKDFKMDGFRPGKVPLHIIKRQYGLKVREEVLNQIFESSLQDALSQNGLQPITQLDIQPHGMDEGMGMKYEASFEVMPEFVLMPFEALEVTRYLPEISDADVDEAIERVRNLQATWHRRERPAQIGDRVIVSFEGRVGEESVTEGRVENYPVILGGAEKIPGFEENLIGKTGNSHIEFDVKFPEDYPKADMADKVVNFRVDLIRVEEQEVPELGAEWIKSLGVEDGEYESLRNNFRLEMEREMKGIAHTKTKTSVIDVLCAANPITIPTALVENEVQTAITALRSEAEQKKQSVDESQARQFYLPEARKRVTLSLLFGRIVELYPIKLEKHHVDSTLMAVASAYQNADEIMQWYRRDKKSFESIERLAHENLIVDFILEKAQVREVILNPRDVSST